MFTDLITKLKRIWRALGRIEGDYICPPWPGPEERSAPYVWNGYRPTAILARTRAVYSAALGAYFELVKRWFPRFKDDLSLASKDSVHDCRNDCKVDKIRMGWTTDSGLDYYLEGPTRTLVKSVVEFELV